MIRGYDFSHYQKDTFTQWLDGDFYILKATEGKSYKDKSTPFIADYLTGICHKDVGFYHYAHPEKNTAKAEANHFLKTIERYLPCVLALDWEGEALKLNIRWAREWLDYVYAKTGIRPLFYAQSSYIPHIGNAISSGNYGLWVARYSFFAPNTGAWNTYAIWQKSSKPCDTDYFNGSLESFRAYGRRDPKWHQ